MTTETLELILEQHGIHPDFWPEMQAMAIGNVRPSKELLTRLRHVANYKAAFHDILDELSQPVKHKLLPKRYQSLEVPA
jgi:hypothetical protein